MTNPLGPGRQDHRRLCNRVVMTKLRLSTIPDDNKPRFSSQVLLAPAQSVRPEMALPDNRIEEAWKSVVEGIERVDFRLRPCDPLADRAITDLDVTFGVEALPKLDKKCN